MSSNGESAVLLDRADVVEEVSKLSARNAASRQAYESWTHDLRTQTQKLFVIVLNCENRLKKLNYAFAIDHRAQHFCCLPHMHTVQ